MKIKESLKREWDKVREVQVEGSKNERKAKWLIVVFVVGYLVGSVIYFGLECLSG